MFGIGPVPWTGDAYWARFSVILVNVWIGAPFFMIMYLAALKSVPEQLYEAAEIDGANWWQRMWYVTLPMMRNIIAITALFSLIVTFANFDIVRILTQGGPIDKTHVFATWSFWLGIQGGDIPLGASVSLFMVPILGDRGGLHPARHQPAGERSIHERSHRRQRGPRRAAGAIRQHEPRPALGAALVVFLPGAVRDLLPDAADLHVHHLAEDQRGDFGGDQSLVGLQPDAVQLRRAAHLAAII